MSEDEKKGAYKGYMEGSCAPSLHVESSDPEMEITGNWADELDVNT